MVLGNVPKLHALVGLLAASAAIPLGCSNDDFEGCAASRTCKPNHTGGTSGSGTGGESGANDGGAGTTSGGSAGTGEAGRSDGGEAGSGNDTTRPTVVSITPDDGDTDVERDVEITVTLSEPIDPASVTRRSATLEGPDGTITGTLGVDGDVITFTAEKPLYLLGDYTFTLSDSIADLAGNTLAEAASVGFRVRDGRWSEPTYPFGQTTPRLIYQFARNNLGDIVIGGGTNDADARLWAGVYNLTEDHWTRDDNVWSWPSVDLYVSDLAIDDERRVALTWGGFGIDDAGWFRFTDETGWIDAGAQSGNSYVAISNRGLAVSVWGEGPDLLTQTQDIATGQVEAATRFGPLDRIAYPVVPSLEKIAMVTRVWPSGDNALHVTWYDPVNGWGAPYPLVIDPDTSQVVTESDEQGNVVVLWTQGAEIWSRVYDRAGDQWTRAMLVTTLDSTAGLGLPDMAAGNVVATFGDDSSSAIWSAYYQKGVGWVEDSIVKVVDPQAYVGFSATIDTAGNVLVVWDGLHRRRYVRGEGWLPAESGEAGFSPFNAAAAPDGTVTVIGNRPLDADQWVPVVAHFE